MTDSATLFAKAQQLIPGGVNSPVRACRSVGCDPLFIASANGSNAVNISFAAMDPFFAMVRFVSTKAFPPVSNNWGYYGNAEVDKLVADARTSFDDKTRDAALARLHQYIVDDAPFVWIAHDVGPRAMSPKLTNVVQPRSWFIDIATMTMD